jgi:hypothetical protein
MLLDYMDIMDLTQFFMRFLSDEKLSLSPEALLAYDEIPCLPGVVWAAQ